MNDPTSETVDPLHDTLEEFYGSQDWKSRPPVAQVVCYHQKSSRSRLHCILMADHLGNHMGQDRIGRRRYWANERETPLW